MWQDRRIIDLLGIDHPILLAPMAGSTNPAFVAAVSEAGGLGGLGAAAQKPDVLRASIGEIRERTSRPFNVNLFCASTESFDREVRPSRELILLLESYHEELGLGEIPAPRGLFGPAVDQLDVLLEEGVRVISLHFGVDRDSVERIHEAEGVLMCSATTVNEARLLEEAGVDIIIAQGAEAGGHRGTFDGDYRHALVGTLALVPRIVDAVSVPVVAAGGIMDARGLVACLALGASAVQLGTAFLACNEAPVAVAWQDALMSAEAEDTTVTEALSGKPARGLRTRYIEEVEALGGPLLPYPAQYAISSALRREATKLGQHEFMVMWAGQGVGLIKRQPVAALMNDLVKGAEELIGQMAGL